MKKADTNYKVTGILANGKRFKAIHTNSPRNAYYALKGESWDGQD